MLRTHTALIHISVSVYRRVVFKNKETKWLDWVFNKIRTLLVWFNVLATLPVSPLFVEYSFKSAEYTTPAAFCCPTVKKFTIHAPRQTTHPHPPSGGGLWFTLITVSACWSSSSETSWHLSSDVMSDMEFSFLLLRITKVLLCPPEALFRCSSVDLGAQLSSSNLAVTCQLESVEQNHVNSRINRHE